MQYGRKFEDALIYAARVHNGQKRKGSETPYITHLLAVAAIVGENGGTEDEVAAALLHDAPEDQGGEERLSDIRVRFGDEVAGIVAGCSDTFEDPKPNWNERKRKYIERVRDASPSVRLVSAADKLHNARAILYDYRLVGEEVWGRFKGGKDNTLRYYRSLIEAFGGPNSSPLVAELYRVVRELERLAGETAIQTDSP